MDTKEKLLRTAARLFSERGYKGVGAREIAQEAGVSLSGIPYHFKTKEALYLAVMPLQEPCDCGKPPKTGKHNHNSVHLCFCYYYCILLLCIVYYYCTLRIVLCFCYYYCMLLLYIVYMYFYCTLKNCRKSFLLTLVFFQKYSKSGRFE